MVCDSSSSNKRRKSKQVDEFNSTQEALMASIDPLIDTISAVILASTSGDRMEVRDKTMVMGKATSMTVERAKQLAVQAKDEDVHRAVSVAISEITGSVHKLIAAQADLIQTSQNFDRQRLFAETTRGVGEAINKLLLAADTTFSQKILSLCPRVKSSAEAFCFIESRQELLRRISDHSEDVLRLLIYMKRTVTCTVAPEKGKLLDQKAEELKTADYRLILAKKDADYNLTMDRLHFLKMLVDQIASIATASGPNFMNKINSSLTRVENILALALRAGSASAKLLATVGHASNADFVKAAKAAAQAALYLVNEASTYLNDVKDPVLRAQLEDTIGVLRAAIHKYLASARACQENPNDPALRAAMEADYRAMQAALNSMTALLHPSRATPDQKLEATVEWMKNLVGRIAEGDPSAAKFLGDADILGQAVMQLARQAEEFAGLQADPDAQRAIMGRVQEATKQVQDFVALAKKLAARPNDFALKQSLLDAAKTLSSSLSDCLKTVAVTVPEPELPTPHLAPKPVDEESTEWDHTDIVKAAKEQADEALQLAAEAESMLADIRDPAQRKLLEEYIQQLKDASSQLVRAARALAQNPNDPALQAALSNAQAHLASCVKNVVGMTMQGHQGADEALRAMEASSSAEGTQKEDDIFQLGTSLISEFENLFLSMDTMTAKELLEASARLSQAATKLAQQLKELADRTTDPVFKNVLIQSSKLIRDRNVQMKILTAVKAADVRHDQVLGPDNQVLMAAGGVQTEIKDVLSTIQATKLKRRIDASKTNAENIRKIIRFYRENPNRRYRA